MVVLSLVALNCFSSEKALPGVSGTGQITGKVVGPDGTAISGVTITTSHNGEVLTATSSSGGSFGFTLKDVQRGSGFNLLFSRQNFENAARAAVISLPNLKVDIGDVVLYIVGGSGELSLRRISGQILDNFSYKPLAGANVTTIDSAGQDLAGMTDENGRFTLESSYLALASTFAVRIDKSHYITRTDVIVAVTAEVNTIRNNPVRLYQKFGSVYGYVTDDSLGTALNGVSVSLTNSNNQQISCFTGGNAGIYDAPEPLAPGFFCPDMDDDFGTPNSGANSGGFKIKDQFLLLGNRYLVTLSKTSAACASRATGASDCYRTKTTYADVLLTGNNAIPGLTQSLFWDAWIYGTVSAGAGVKVRLHNDSDTFIRETTTTSGGAFLLDDPLLLRGAQYKLTFEKDGYSSRLIGNPGPNDPVLVTISVRGANNAGAVTMTALPPPGQTMTGAVTDFWSTQPISGALVSITDNSGLRTTTTDVAGVFSIGGNFTCGNNYVLQISKTGYTGELLVARQTLKISLPIDAFLTASGGGCIRSAGPPTFNLSSVSVCGAEASPGAGTTACADYTRLYPIGLFANISGVGVLNPGFRRFQSQLKQTYEKFLTEKTGLTLSGRTGALQLTSALPQKNWDYDTLYLHFDDTPRILPNPPEGRWSNHVPVNPLPGACTPTVTENCSPRANGVLTEGIGADERTVQWDLKTYVYYHFYAAAPGLYTIETTGSTDTHITLIAQTGATMGSDDDSGSGSNARIGPISLTRGWYYIKVRGKNDNVFGFFDVRVTGPPASESNYSTMLSPTAAYATNCGTNNGNLVLSWYDATQHLLYIAAPGEGGACSASATIEKHGPVGEIIRGRFDGALRPLAAGGGNATVQGSPTRGFFNLVRQE